MNCIDWVELWVLDTLVEYGAAFSLFDLILRPRQLQTHYWDFPAGAALRTDVEVRTDRVLNCINSGLVEVYATASNRGRTGIRAPLTAEECKWHDHHFLEETAVCLTLAGHNKWEAEFVPDWGRFWVNVGSRTSTDGCCSENEQILAILYASDEIFDELLRWSPVYWGFDPEFGLTEVDERYTTFQYQATVWKVLPCAKVITWKGVSNAGAFNKVYRQLFYGGSAHEGEQAAQTKMNAYLEAKRLEHAQAHHILCRLSKKWDIHPTPNARQLDDREPKLRLA